MRKVGRLTPIRLKVRKKRDSQERRKRPVKTPMGTPTSSARAAAQKASSSVAGARSAMSSATGRDRR